MVLMGKAEGKETTKHNRRGKSFAKCYVCGKKFKLRKTKHNSRHLVRALCPDCGMEQQEDAEKRKKK